MNLLQQNFWDFAYPWGNIINPNTTGEICISDKLVSFGSNGEIRLKCARGPCNGWKRDQNWNIVNTTAQWSVGAIIMKDACRTHFGVYHFRFRLPDFRGSWPAIWLIDLHPAPPKGDGMGIPPEIDIIEHFRKDGFISRFTMHHTFHQGPTYANDHVISKKYHRLLPLDTADIDLVLRWLPTGLTWIVNGVVLQFIPPDSLGFPVKPMNLIINAGLGLDWKPDTTKFADFIVKKAEYQPV